MQDFKEEICLIVKNPYDTYKKNAITTATPGELTYMLYDGCLKNIRKAKHAIEEKDYAKKSDGISKAQSILRELQITLDPKIALTESMKLMYDYMMRRLSDANIKNDCEVLSEIEGYAVEFRDSWKQAMQISRSNQPVSGDSV